MSQSEDDIPPRPRASLYLITPPHLEDEAAFLSDLENVLETGMVTALQLRLKLDDRTRPDLGAMNRIGTAINAHATHTDTALLINDSAAIAADIGADGVHLGQSDGDLKSARALLGPDAIIGMTCHDSRHLAMQAGEQGADYVAFGAFHPTTTKDAATRANPDLLTWWQGLMELPCVAIGGITHDNAGPLVRAGADFIAVSGAVWAYPEGPVAAVKAFDALLEAEHSAQNA